MKRLICFILLIALFSGCRSTRTATMPAAPHITVLTYNVNWGGARPELTAEIIRRSGAEIVCLQETTPEWEQFLRQVLAKDYPFAEFRDSRGRMGGGLAFLAKVPAREVAYIPSDTGWFDGWIMKFETAIGPMQALNVHLHPPVSDSGGWVSGYFNTRDDRRVEIEKFYAKRDPNLPMLVLGDFNDGENSAVTRWLQSKGLVNSLPQFDRSTPTWKWETRMVTLKRRMDHIFYSEELDCAAARVIVEGASDHFPVEAVFIGRSRGGRSLGN